MKKTGKGGITATIIKDSISEFGDRITTFELEYPRFIHGELMTHRCLAGDTLLEFDLPSGSTNSSFRKYEMSIKDFHNKWHEGASPRKSSRFVEYNFSNIKEDELYSAKELSELMGGLSVSSIRTRCRSKRLNVQNYNKSRSEDYIILGSDFINCYSKALESRQNLRSRLEKMNIRMLNEDTNRVTHTNITDVWLVGTKKTYELKAGDLSITTTDDHLILTDTGWKELKDISVGESIMSYGLGKDAVSDPNTHKKIDGKWVSSSNKAILPLLSEEQDGKCYNCEVEDVLEVHHVKPVHSHPELAFDRDNLIAVCNDCHKNHYHKKQGWQVGCELIGKPVTVESIDFVCEQDVYDLSVSSDYHNFIANGIVVHNCFSRNAMSSRAVPVSKMIEQVRTNPAMPIHWGKNQAGMQANTELSGYDLLETKASWIEASREAATKAENMVDFGAHKQVVNRILEPFQMMKTIVTATEYGNFFSLRCHEDAQPEIHELADIMKECMDESDPDKLKAGEWHIPYVDSFRASDGDAFLEHHSNNIGMSVEEALKVSASCCAQVSYRLLDNSVEKAIVIYDKLVESKPIHASPFEHQAKVMREWEFDHRDPDLSSEEGITHTDWDGNFWSGNFKGWIQYRQLI